MLPRFVGVSQNSAAGDCAVESASDMAITASAATAPRCMPPCDCAPTASATPGRGATVISPFVVGSLMVDYGCRA